MQPTREELAEALRALVDETLMGEGREPGAPPQPPRHGHGLLGGLVSNEPCALCHAWNRAFTLREQLRAEKASPARGSLQKVTITEVRRVVEAHRAAQGIVILFGGGRFASASYGTTKALCSLVAKTLDAIADGLVDGRIPAP